MAALQGAPLVQRCSIPPQVSVFYRETKRCNNFTKSKPAVQGRPLVQRASIPGLAFMDPWRLHKGRPLHSGARSLRKSLCSLLTRDGVVTSANRDLPYKSRNLYSGHRFQDWHSRIRSLLVRWPHVGEDRESPSKTSWISEYL